MQIGGIGSSPFGASPLGGGGAGAGNAQTLGDLQQQKAQNAFQEEVAKESNMEAKRNKTRMAVINNMA